MSWWNKTSKLWIYTCANLSGVLYSFVIIFGIAGLNVFYTCPNTFGDACYPYYYHAAVIFTELVANLILFHFAIVKNRVSYWTVKSSAIPNSDFGNYCNETDNLLVEQGQYSQYDLDAINESPSRHQKERLVITQDGIYRREQWVPDEVPKGRTKFCEECKSIMPRRSHHCPLCRICVLRKDHHCFITGGCVGLANQRYFIVFLFWACIGAAYGSYFTFAFMHNRMVENWFPCEFIKFFTPVACVRWMLGYDSLYTLLFSVVLCASLASCFAALGFFVVQMFYTLNGYTMHDYHIGRLKDQLESDGKNYSERLALVFGKRWWLNFIFPQFWNSNEMTPEIARNIFLSVSKDL